jgi:hypothetical protein
MGSVAAKFICHRFCPIFIGSIFLAVICAVSRCFMHDGADVPIVSHQLQAFSEYVLFNDGLKIKRPVYCNWAS